MHRASRNGRVCRGGGRTRGDTRARGGRRVGSGDGGHNSGVTCRVDNRRRNRRDTAGIASRGDESRIAGRLGRVGRVGRVVLLAARLRGFRCMNLGGVRILGGCGGLDAGRIRRD